MIRETLCNLSDDSVKTVAAKLEECGVENVSDLSYVTDTDLSDTGILKPIQIRKLLAAWKEYGKYCYMVFSSPL